MKITIVLLSLLISVAAWANQDPAETSQPATTTAAQTQKETTTASDDSAEQNNVERNGVERAEVERTRSYDRPIASSRDRSQRGRR